MSAYQKITNAAADVVRGRYVDASQLKPAHTEDVTAIEHLINSDGKTVLLRSMTDTRHSEAEAIVWGPFTVKKYTYDQANNDLCHANYYSWCKPGYVCVRLEPVDSGEYLSHKHDGKNMDVESGDADSCERVIEFGRVADDVVSFRFISWSSQRDHVGMRTDTTPVTMWDYTLSADVDTMYQWNLVEEVTAEPTAQPTLEPSTAVPTSIETPVPSAQPVNPTALPPAEPTPAPSHTIVAPPHPTAHSPAAASSSLPNGAIVGIAVAAAVLIIGALLAVMAVRRNRRKTGTVSRLEVENGGDEIEASVSEAPARAAFKDSNIAGELATPLVNTTVATNASDQQEAVVLAESSDAFDDL